jgi:mevalonate kinase
MKQVADVRTRRDLYPTIMDPLIDAVGKVSETCKALFDAQHEDAEIQKALSFLIDANHGLLVAMGTSHASLEKVREVTARVGLSSKLTGGGGGGCAITLVRDGGLQHASGRGHDN